MPPLPHEGSGYLPDTNCNGACYHNAKAEEEPHRPRCGDAGGVVPNGCAGSGARSAEEEVDEGEWEVGAEEWRWLRRCVKAAGKGFAIGAGLKGGLALFGILAGMRRRRRKQGPRKVGVLSNEEALAIALKETLRYGLFLGTFAGTFVSVDECIAAVGGRKKTSRWRSLFAGAVAGPSMLLTGPGTQHTSLAVYILMRAAVLASRCGIKSKRFGNVCKPLTWSYGDIFLMCLSSSQILSAYILKQDSLPSTYRSFLNKHGGKDAVILEGVKNIASGLPFNNLEGIEGYYKSTGVDIKLDPNMKVPCSIIHGHQSCAGHLLSFFLQAYGRALPVYIPVYLIPALIVHREDLLKRPNMILWKNLIGTARSSLFLSAYCSSAWMWTCFFFRIFKRCNIPMVAMGTFPTGLALAIEKKSRRIEISLYCLARAIESFFTCLSDAGYCPQAAQLKRADVVVFSVSTAIIMHCYSQERDVFRSKYLNVLDWVFGVPPQENSNFQSNGCFNCVEGMDTSTRESLQGESCSFYDTPNYLEDMNGYHVKSSTTRNGTCLSNGNLKHVPDSETPP